MSLPSGLSSYEFQRELTRSRDLPHYFHLRLLKDDQGLPLLAPENNALHPIDLAGFFGAPGPIEVEVGCGKGTFMAAYCERHPELPFLALEKEAEIAYLAAGRVSRRPQISHARVVLGDAMIFFRDFLPVNCVKAFHVYFPDPWPKKRHHDHRLFNARFIEAVHRTLRPGGRLHFATDHLPYFEEVKAAFAADRRFEEIPAFEPSEEERTDFELYYRKHAVIGRYSVTRRDPAGE